MAQEQLHVSIHAVVYGVHHQMGQGATEFGANALHGQLLRVNDGVVAAEPISNLIGGMASYLTMRLVTSKEFKKSSS